MNMTTSKTGIRTKYARPETKHIRLEHDCQIMAGSKIGLVSTNVTVDNFTEAEDVDAGFSDSNIFD